LKQTTPIFEPPGPSIFFQRREEIHLLRLEFLISFVDVIDGEGDAADADVIQRWIGLPLRRRIDKLHEIEHRRVGVGSQAHEDTAQLARLEPQGIADARIVEGEIVDLVKADVLVEADRPLHIANADVDVKQLLQHRGSPGRRGGFRRADLMR